MPTDKVFFEFFISWMIEVLKTLIFSARISSFVKLAGLSMARSERSCRVWFWTMSRRHRIGHSSHHVLLHQALRKGNLNIVDKILVPNVFKKSSLQSELQRCFGSFPYQDNGRYGKFVLRQMLLGVRHSTCLQLRNLYQMVFNDQALKTFAIDNVFRFEVFGNGSKELRCHRQEEELIVFSLVFSLSSACN